MVPQDCAPDSVLIMHSHAITQTANAAYRESCTLGALYLGDFFNVSLAFFCNPKHHVEGDCDCCAAVIKPSTRERSKKMNLRFLITAILKTKVAIKVPFVLQLHSVTHKKGFRELLDCKSRIHKFWAFPENCLGYGGKFDTPHVFCARG